MILQELKNQTQQLHRRVEDCLNVLNNSPTMEGYQRVLAKLYGFYVPLEKMIFDEGRLDAVTTETERRGNKSRWLARDILRLWPKTDLEKIPRCPQLPSVTNVAEALGALYVFEGVTLGGQTIARHLARNLHLSPEVGTAFFFGYGSDTGTMWKSYQALLIRSAESGMDFEIVRSAKSTFDKLAFWLGGH